MDSLFSLKALRLSLYSGIALVVLSMLFLGREVETSPFVIQAALAAAAPAFFYGTGTLVYRHLNAPLAAPGIVGTGAWLVVVELVHFYDRRDLLPGLASDYYWLIAALLAAVIVTLTAYRARLWLLVPLVPLTHINVLWAVLGATGLGIAWWPVLSFALVLAWWEWPLDDLEWRRVYRVAALLFEVFLLVFSYWLPAQTAHSMLITWGACALLVAVLAVRHGWISLGPLSIALLACASAWGLPVTWWPPVWLGIASGTLFFIERLARHDPDANALALDLSTALAVLLTGLAALLAKGMPTWGYAMHPLMLAAVMAGCGTLLIALGQRRRLTTAEHAGLWLLAAAWAELYFDWVPDRRAYGLWLGLLAVTALLVERLLFSLGRRKRKALYSVREVVAGWPLADLIVGLSAIIVLWAGIAALEMPSPTADPLVIGATVGVVIGVWLAAGLMYRMPVLIHVALWLAPLPTALILVLLVPALRTLPMLGLAWQGLALIYLLIGHLLPRYRVPLIAPFMLAGYALLGLGLTLAAADAMLLLAALLVVALVCALTAAAVLAGEYPTWDLLVARLIAPDRRPYAYMHARNIFLFVAAWLLAIWLVLMVGAAGFRPAQQGVVLVLLSSAWIVLGRLLPHLPGVVAGWPVYGAGWFMWLAGLLLVFFSPAEAIVTAIFGLALSAEALYRSKAIHWMPAFILQILFSVLQVAWMLDLPGHGLLLAVTLGLSAAGMAYESANRQAGRITAGMGGALSLLIWLLFLDPLSTLGIVLLALGGLAVYRRWPFLLAAGLPLAVLILKFGPATLWPALIGLGGLLVVAGSLLVARLRPRRFRTLRQIFQAEADWATPLLWGGVLSTAAGLFVGRQHTADWGELVPWLLGSAAVVAVCTVWLRVPRLPYVPLVMLSGTLLLTIGRLAALPYQAAGKPMAAFGMALVLVALALQALAYGALDLARLSSHARWLTWWIRPLLHTKAFLAVTGLAVALMAQIYPCSPLWFAATSLLLSLTLALVFWRTRIIRWAGAALALGWLAWVALLAALGATGVLWHTLPPGIGLLIFARWPRLNDPAPVEIGGIGLLLCGSVIDFQEHGMVLSTAVLLAVQLVGLMVYGWAKGRALPFLSGLVVILGGLLWVMAQVSLWLIPLAAGLFLLGGAVLLEVERERLAHWVSSGLGRFDVVR